MRYVRDYVEHPISIDYFQQRLSDGWKVKAIEWEKEDGAETPDAKNAPPAYTPEPAPYGLEIVSDALVLKQNPEEIAVLLTILEMIVADKGASLIADELNARGQRTRRGTRWTPPAVFDLLPRVIEMGPQLLTTSEWQERRSRILAQV
jgi:hypothetical protein